MKAIQSLIAIASAALLVITSCDDIDIDREIQVSITHPDIIRYRLHLGVNDTTSVANWDTTGNITAGFPAQVGDKVYYRVSTPAPGSQLSISVNGAERLFVDINGTPLNSNAAYLVVE